MIHESATFVPGAWHFAQSVSDLRSDHPERRPLRCPPLTSRSGFRSRSGPSATEPPTVFRLGSPRRGAIPAGIAVFHKAAASLNRDRGAGQYAKQMSLSGLLSVTISKHAIHQSSHGPHFTGETIELRHPKRTLPAHRLHARLFQNAGWRQAGFDHAGDLTLRIVHDDRFRACRLAGGFAWHSAATSVTLRTQSIKSSPHCCTYKIDVLTR